MAGDFMRLLGTLSTFFRIGLNGPALKSDAFRLHSRNIADTTYQPVAVGDPTDPNDAIHKAFLESETSLLTPLVTKIDTIEGVQGGGDFSANRIHKLDINGLAEDVAPDAAADFIAEYDVSAAIHKKVKFSNIPGIVTSSRLISTTEGVQGGGDLSVNRTHKLDINGLTEDLTPDPANDFIAEYDTSAGIHKKVKFSNIPGGGGGEVNLGANVGTGAGFIFRNKTGVTLNFRTVKAGSTKVTIVVSVDDVVVDIVEANIDHDALLNFIANEHIDHSAVSISTSEGIQGGGDITVTRNLKLDINGLAVDAAPDVTADYVATYDASSALHKKVLLSTLSSVLTNNAVIDFGAGSVSSSTTDRFLYPSYDSSIAQTTEVFIIAPRAGIFDKLYILHNAPAGNGNNIIYTVRKNGVNTTLTVTLASTASSGSDLANSFTVVAGDKISIIATKAASIASSPSDIIASLEFKS